MKKVHVYKSLFLFILIGLVSVRFYYIHLLNLKNTFSEEIVYNNGDASHYLQIAGNIADFNVYSDNNSEVATESATWRPPFWPLVLSFLFYISNNPLVLVILKSFIELVILLSAMIFFKRKTDYKLFNLLPFLILFIEPYYLKYTVTFLSESFTSVLILSLTLVFITLKQKKTTHFLIPILSGLIILTHPVAIFFIITLFSFYVWFNFKNNIRTTIFHSIFFLMIILSWPVRNHIIFNKGFYLTASQGATFSKGWNKSVVTEFNNTDGDLANESLNLKYIDSKINDSSQKSTIDLSKLYKSGTISYIKTLTVNEALQIIIIKIKSNFNPFPEKYKAGFLESAAIIFRILYLVTFFQLTYRIFNKGLNFSTIKDKIYIIIFSIFIGQTLMATIIYTGLRFNAIYSLTLLFCFTYLNVDFIREIYNKLFSRNILKRIS